MAQDFIIHLEGSEELQSPKEIILFQNSVKRFIQSEFYKIAEVSLWKKE